MHGDYRPGFLQATELDKRYAWAVASSDGSAAPVQADIYTQANLIAAGDRTLIVSETMWGKIPGDTDWPPLPTHAVTADDMAGILNAHAASPPDGKNYVKFTPTGVATKVGAGNGAYWWIPVTVALEGERSRPSRRRERLHLAHLGARAVDARHRPLLAGDRRPALAAGERRGPLRDLRHGPRRAPGGRRRGAEALADRHPGEQRDADPERDSGGRQPRRRRARSRSRASTTASASSYSGLPPRRRAACSSTSRTCGSSRAGTS